MVVEICTRFTVILFIYECFMCNSLLRSCLKEKDGSVNFHDGDWNYYKSFFGQSSGEYYLGKYSSLPL